MNDNSNGLYSERRRAVKDAIAISLLAVAVSILTLILDIPGLIANWTSSNRTWQLAGSFVVSSIFLLALAVFLTRRSQYLSQALALQMRQQQCHDTERKQLLAILDGIDEVAYVVDPRTYELLYMNGPAKVQWGEGVGQKCYHVLRERDAPCWLCTDDRTLGENVGTPHIWRFHNALTNRWYRCLGRTILWPDGRSVRFEVDIDIDRRKQTEHLLQTRTNLALALNSASSLDRTLDLCINAVLDASDMDAIAIYLLDGDSGLYLASHKGLSEEYAKTISHLDQTFPQMKLLMTKEPVYSAFERVKTSFGGDALPDNLRAFAVLPFFSEGKYVGCMNAFSRDDDAIPEHSREMLEAIASEIGNNIGRFEMEKQLKRHSIEMETLVKERTRQIQQLEHQRAASEKLAATGRMAARIAHEINNPLAGVKSSFQLIKKSVPKEHRYYHYVERIDSEIDRIAEIVRQMYDLYAAAHGTPSRLHIIEVIRDVTSMLEARKDRDSAKIIVKNPKERIVANLSRGFLIQVLYNVIVNAIEASPQGGEVTIEIEAGENTLTVSVHDTGQGIPRKISQRIFEPFFTTKEGMSRTGLGLGLSVSRSLVQTMGGSLTFRSEPEQGTVFRIVLPLEYRDEENEDA